MSRLQWDELPAPLRAGVEEVLGAPSSWRGRSRAASLPDPQIA